MAGFWLSVCFVVIDLEHWVDGWTLCPVTLGLWVSYTWNILEVTAVVLTLATALLNTQHGSKRKTR